MRKSKSVSPYELLVRTNYLIYLLVLVLCLMIGESFGARINSWRLQSEIRNTIHQQELESMCL